MADRAEEETAAVEASHENGALSRAAAETTAARVLRGSLWTVASSLVPQVYTLIVSVAAARFLGPDGMGRQSFIGFVQLSLTSLLAGGLSTSLMRYVGQTLGEGRPGTVRGLIAWAWRVQAAGAAVGGGALVAAGLGGADPRAAWLLAAVGTAIGVLHSVPSALLIGAQLWRQASLVGLVTGAGATAATIAVLATGGGIVGMFAVQAATSAVNLAWTSSLARSAVADLAAPGEQLGGLKASVLGYAAWQSLDVLVAIVVAQRSEFFFLERFSTDAEIALYSISFSAFTAMALLPQAVGRALTPAFATWYGASASARIRASFSRAMRLLLVATMPATAGMLALGPELVRLVFGSDYAGTSPVLRILLCMFPLVPAVSVANALVIGLGRVRVPLALGALAAVIDIALSFALIPSLDAVGAAIANVAAQIVVSVALTAYGVRLAGQVDWRGGSLARSAVASACGGAAAWGVLEAVGGAGGLVAGLAAGVAVFSAIARLIGLFAPDDGPWLAERFGGWAGGIPARLVRFWTAGRSGRA